MANTAPICNPSAYGETVLETHTGVVTTVTCTDADSPTLTYIISSGNTNADFSIGSATGVVYVASGLDYETTTFYHLSISVTDGTLTSAASVSITIAPVNEFNPEFSVGLYTTNIPEDMNPGIAILQVTSTDQDSGIHGTPRYSIVGGNGEGKFTIDEFSGAISIAIPLDREQTSSYSLSIRANDRADVPSDVRTAAPDATIVITVDDVNDNYPVFTPWSYVENMVENVAGGTTVVQVTATDDDSGANSDLLFSITAGNAEGIFSISDDVVAITPGQTLDYETEIFHSLTVRALDQGTPPKSSFANIRIHVIGVNEFAPTLTSPASSTVSIPEDTAIGATIFTVTSSDNDTGIDGVVAYSIVGGNSPSIPFLIDTPTGAVRVWSALDFDTAPQNYSLEILAKDKSGDGSGLTSTMTFDVALINVNDNYPMFTPASYANDVREDAINGTTILRVTAADNDAGADGIVLYSITAGNDAGIFGMNGDAVEIITADNLDYETQTVHSLTVIALDQGVPPKSSLATVSIQVLAVNEFTPSFPANSSLSIPEDTFIGTTIFTAAASDSDTGRDGAVAYWIVSGNAPFMIEPITGVVKVESVLDYDTFPQNYSLEIRAEDNDGDGSGLSSTMTLDVILTNVNDNYPVFTPTTYVKNVTEDVPSGTIVVQVTVTDDDAGADGNLMYSITAGNAQGIFSMSGDAVVIGPGQNLDYETSTFHLLMVEAVDQGSPPKSSYASVNIEVEGVNEFTPTFPNSFTQIISEDTAIGTTIFTVTSSDDDRGSDGAVVYSIVAGNSPGTPFLIDSKTGAVQVWSVLDYDSMPQNYTLEILAQDNNGDGNGLSSSGTFVVALTNVNDNFPVFSPASYAANVTEDVTSGATVTRVTANDDDAGAEGNVVYSITSGNTAGIFTMNGDAVEIAPGHSLDHTTEPLHSVTIEAVDGGSPPKSSFASVSIRVLAVNEFTPTFLSNSSLGIPEDTAIGTTIFTAASSDNDTGSDGAVVYSIVAGNSPGTPFLINPISGTVQVRSVLDYDTFPQNYTLEILAQDNSGDGSGLSSTMTFDVTLINVNDNSPMFTPMTYANDVREDVAIGTTVVRVTATDGDLGAEGNLLYSITAGDTAGIFSVNGDAVEIAAGQSLDYETQTLHSLTVKAEDQGIPPRSSFATVSIQVLAVNEFTPTFPSNSTKTIPEDTAVGTAIFTPTSSDNDTYSDGAVVYSIVAGNSPGTPFRIDPITGIVKVSSVLDYDTGPQNYTLEIQAQDNNGDGSGLSSTMTLAVTLINVNDNYPVFTPTSYVKDVTEDVTAATTVVRVTATDDDADAEGNLLYFITAGNTDGIFSMDGDAVQIAPFRSLDYETQTRYLLTVKAEDQGIPPKSSFASVSIQVLAVNEFEPTFPANSSRIIPEDAAVGTTIFTAASSDNDTGSDGVVVYSIVAGNLPGTPFLINPVTGNVQVWSVLDYDTGPQNYTLEILAQDDSGDGSGLSSTMTLDVILTNVNDNYPVFTPTSYVKNVTEDVTTGAAVMRVTATDDDAGAAGNVLYTITAGNTAGIFGMNGDALEIVATDNLNYETQAVHLLTVMAMDQGIPPKSSFASVSIQVLAVNEFTPTFPSNSSLSIPEDTAIGTTIFTAASSDNDTGSDGAVVYSILSGNSPGTPFQINPSTGAVQVISVLDYDTAPQDYTLGILAQDHGGDGTGLSSTMTLRVILMNVNDETPTFSQNTYIFLLEENTDESTPVGSVLAHDADSGASGQVVYSVVAGDGVDIFTIGNITGEIHTDAAASIDFEIKEQYSLVVRATDGGSPPRTSQCLVNLVVTDLNDNYPVFQPADFTVSILENATTSTSVTLVSAIDGDAGPNGVLTFSISPATHFSINATTGVISTTQTLDRETTPLYALTVQAVDQGSAPLTGTASVTVVVADVNDNGPLIVGINGTYEKSVPEDTSQGTIVFRVNSTDADDGVNALLTYNITSGNTNADWKIGARSGIVQVSNELDFENTTSYHLVITVADGGTPPESASMTLSLTIVDVNDNNPVFVSTPYSFNIEENVPLGTSVGSVTATDTDTGVNAAIIYSLTDMVSRPPHFAVNLTNGDIITASNLDRESLDRHVVLCKVTDNGNPPLSSEIDVTVTISDLNDNAPVFSASSYSGSVTENSGIGTSILDVIVTDNDIGENANVTLYIDALAAGGAKADQLLAVDTSTGIISVKQAIDRETDPSLIFELLAIDGGVTPLTGTTTVTVSIIDENDNSPVFTSLFLNLEKPFDSRCTNVIARVTATDVDEGSNGIASYYLVPSSHDYLFAVDEYTGEVIMKATAVANTQYVVYVTARDNGVSRQTADNNIALRIDTFDPEDNGISFTLSASREYYLANEQSFLDGMTSVFKAWYPTAAVRRWCLEEKTTDPVIDPVKRRRRLATGDKPVTVHLYVLANNNTDSIGNIAESKTFLSATEALSVVTASSDGSPAPSITGSAWNNYGISQVAVYRGPWTGNTPWLYTPVGLFGVSGCGLLLLIALIVFVVYFTKNKDRHTTQARRTSWTAPEKKKTRWNYHSKKKKKKKGKSVASDILNDIAIPKVRRETDRRPALPWTKMGVDSSESGVETGNSKPDVDRAMDVDPESGTLYEYDTQTHERRFMAKPDGSGLKVNSLGNLTR